jgi:ABC-type dipeptide/oligopeptide/nickel transport system permease subunit
VAAGLRRIAAVTPWLAIRPAVALSRAGFGFDLLEGAQRDLLDPRLKGG